MGAVLGGAAALGAGAALGGAADGAVSTVPALEGRSGVYPRLLYGHYWWYRLTRY